MSRERWWQQLGPKYLRHRHATALGISRCFQYRWRTRPTTHINLIALEVPQGKELVELDKFEPKRLGNVHLALLLEL